MLTESIVQGGGGELLNSSSGGSVDVPFGASVGSSIGELGSSLEVVGIIVGT